MLHNDIIAGSRTNRSVMPYHPSRPVTSPLHYIETSSSLVGEEMWRLEWAPPFPSQLNGPQRQLKGEVLDPVCKSSCDEALLDEGMILEGALAICLQKLQLLSDVGALLVILAVPMHIGEESPVIKVVDSILEEGIHCSVTSEAMVEPGG